MLLFYAVHYPHPEKAEQLIQRMHAFGKLIEKQPGIIFVNTFRDPEKCTLIASVIWESQEAFQTAWPVLTKDAPAEELEVKPREVYLFPSAM